MQAPGRDDDAGCDSVVGGAGSPSDPGDPMGPGDCDSTGVSDSAAAGEAPRVGRASLDLGPAGEASNLDRDPGSEMQELYPFPEAPSLPPWRKRERVGRRWGDAGRWVGEDSGPRGGGVDFWWDGMGLWGPRVAEGSSSVAWRHGGVACRGLWCRIPLRVILELLGCPEGEGQPGRRPASHR